MGSNIFIRKVFMDRSPLHQTVAVLKEKLPVAITQDAVLALAFGSGNNIKASQMSLQLILPSLEASDCGIPSKRECNKIDDLHPKKLVSFTDYLREIQLDVSVFDTIESRLSLTENTSVSERHETYVIPKSPIIFDIFPKHVSCFRGSLVDVKYIQIKGSFCMTSPLDSDECEISVFLGNQKCFTEVLSESLLYFQLPNKFYISGIYDVVVHALYKGDKFKGSSITTSRTTTAQHVSWLNVVQNTLKGKSQIWKPLLVHPSAPTVNVVRGNPNRLRKKVVVSDDEVDDDDFVESAVKPLRGSHQRLVHDDDSDTQAVFYTDRFSSTSENQFHKILIEIIELLASYDCAPELFTFPKENLLAVEHRESVNSYVKSWLNLGTIADSVLDGLYGNLYSYSGFQAFTEDVRSVWERLSDFKSISATKLSETHFLSNVFELTISRIVTSLDTSISHFENRLVSVSCVKETNVFVSKPLNIPIPRQYSITLDQSDSLQSLCSLLFYISDSDILLSAAIATPDSINFTSYENAGVFGDMLEEKVFDEKVFDEKEFDKNCHDKNIFSKATLRCRENYTDYVQYSDQLSFLSSNLRSLAEKTFGYIFRSSSQTIHGLHSTSETKELSNDTTNDYFSLMFELRRSLNAGVVSKYTFTLYRRFLLVCLFHDGFSSMKSDEVLKISKKLTLCSQTANLFHLAPDIAVDFLPFMCHILRSDQDNSSKFLDVSVRHRRDTRRSLAASVLSRFQYCAKVFLDLPDSFYDTILMAADQFSSKNELYS